MCDCDIDILKDAKHVGRAHWVCPKCNKDISLLYYFTWKAVNGDTEKELKETQQAAKQVEQAAKRKHKK